MILVIPLLLRFFGRGIVAMAIFPFILLRDASLKENQVTINHERIHFKQQLELLVIPFYLLYFGFYIYLRLRGLKHFEAYYKIPFEEEAYQYESNLEYLNNRKSYAWLKAVWK